VSNAQGSSVQANDMDIWQDFIVDFQGNETQDYSGMYNFDIPK
jgi:hypothetical protein